MKIFSAAQIREWDQYTITQHNISSVDLMEKAAAACTQWICDNYKPDRPIILFCGNGNNGGDGLAIARMLHLKEYAVYVYLPVAEKRSADCGINLERLSDLPVKTTIIHNETMFPVIGPGDIVVDALFGTGLNKPIEGLNRLLIQYLNNSEASIISIDIPSGMFADISSAGNTVISAEHTLSFQSCKMAFLMPENGRYTGKISLLDIGLSKEYDDAAVSDASTLGEEQVKSFVKKRNSSSHKYHFGHALLFAGSAPMMGAAILSARACLRSGAGLVTVHTAAAQMAVLQTALPEEIASSADDLDVIIVKKAALAFGPGLEINETNRNLLHQVIETTCIPLVIDASGLGLLQSALSLMHPGNKKTIILTPHAGEFEKLFGKTDNDFERMRLALSKAATHHCYIVLKSHHTMIVCPDGEIFFNTTGNSGMATAGSGDVLTGIITGLLAQQYTAREACLLGVYLHGLSGDLASEKYSEEAMIAGDITEQLGNAYKLLHRK